MVKVGDGSWGILAPLLHLHIAPGTAMSEAKNLLASIKSERNGDSTKLTLAVPQMELDAATVDLLIRGLIWERAQMSPGHPRQPPELQEWVYVLLDRYGFGAIPGQAGVPGEVGF